MTDTINSDYIELNLTDLKLRLVLLIRARKPKMETLELILIITRILVYIAAAGVLVYIALILKEIRKIVEDAKDVVKVGRDITTSIASPVNSIIGLLSGVTKGINAIKSVTDLFNKGEEDEYEEY